MLCPVPGNHGTHLASDLLLVFWREPEASILRISQGLGGTCRVAG